jgi:gentisate 1,2-dioxygenase
MATQSRPLTAEEATPSLVDDDAGVPPTLAATTYASRARYFDSSNAFALKYPKVPSHQFVAERDRAVDPATGTALILLDLSAELGLDYPATTPLILTAYARIRAGEKLATRFKGSGELYYVMRGRGRTTNRADSIGWAPGDVFCLPGGGETVHSAGAEDCLLWAISNEPELAFENLEPGKPVTAAVHYPAAEIESQLKRVAQKLDGSKIAGLALIFSSEEQAWRRNVLPTMTLALNQLPPHEYQRPHAHNAVAVTLCIQGEKCYSVIDGTRKEWQADAVMVTPPGDVHSHHNDGNQWMSCLIVQDGGLHYHCRTMDFQFGD